MTAEHMDTWLRAMYCTKIISTRIQTKDMNCHISYGYIKSVVDQEMVDIATDNTEEEEPLLFVTIVIEGDVILSMSTGL